MMTKPDDHIDNIYFIVIEYDDDDSSLALLSKKIIN